MANGWGQDQTGQKLCGKCHSQLTWVPQYNKWYCYNCGTYEGAATDTSEDVQPQKTQSPCPTCGDILYYIKRYNQHYCYKCNVYSAVSAGPQEPAELVPPPRIAPAASRERTISAVEASTIYAPVLKCPECGESVEQGWVRCPNCRAGLETSAMPDRPISTHDEKPKDLHSKTSELGKHEREIAGLPYSLPKETVHKPPEVRRGGEFAWEPQAMRETEKRHEDADDERYKWQAATSDEHKVRDLIAEEERLTREKAARDEALGYRRSTRQETDERSSSADAIRDVREVQAKSVRKAWEVHNEPVKPDVKGPDGEYPDEHAVTLDNELEFLIDLFQALLGAFLKEPMQPISFYRSKLKVLGDKSEAIRKIKVGDDGQVKIFVRSGDFNKVLSELSGILDTIIDVEAKISTRAEALARAKEAIWPIVQDYQDELEDLGIATKLMNRAFATRLPSGIPGFDEMLHGGIPNGASIILQGSVSGEKEVFANQFLGCGLNENGSIMVVVTMISPDEWRTQMRSLGHRLSDFEKEGQIVIVDWYTHKNERVRSVEVRGPVVLSSKSITNLEIAIDKAIKSIKDAPTKRAVIAILSPAIKALGFDMVYGFAQSIRGKFKKHNITGLFLLDKGMHEQNIVTSLHSVFDGVFDIERERVGDAMVSKIGVLTLKGLPFENKYHVLENTREGLVVKNGQTANAPAGAAPRY